MSAPTTEEVNEALKFARAALEASGASPDVSLYAGMVAALESTAIPLAERRDALHLALTKIDAIRNSIVGRQSVNWSEHIYPLVNALNEAGFGGEGYAVARPKAEAETAEVRKVFEERDALLAEVARLREVIATKHAIERSSVGVAALVEECEKLHVEVKRLRQAFLTKSIKLLVAEQPKKEDDDG